MKSSRFLGLTMAGLALGHIRALERAGDELLVIEPDHGDDVTPPPPPTETEAQRQRRHAGKRECQRRRRQMERLRAKRGEA